MRGFERLGQIARQRGLRTDGRPEFCLLRENVPVLRLWNDLQSQWQHGMAGPTGFNWASVREHPAVRCIPRGRREGLLEGIADMESAWLSERARIAAEKHQQAC